MATPVPDRARVLYLGLDACDAPTMMALVRDGQCPNLEGLLADAARAETEAPYGTFVGSVWMTFTTAWKVGRHRYYNWVELDRDTYEPRLTTPLDARGRPFWSQLSEQGRRVAVFDVPHSDVPADFNGVLVKEWGCHDRHHGPGSFPADLLDELGPHPYGSGPHPRGDTQFAPCDYILRDGAHRRFDEERQLVDLILEGVEAKATACEQLLSEGDWDAFIAILGESHCVGHQLWHVHDPDHQRHDPATRAILGDPVVAVYQAIDAAVGRILHAAGPNALCFVHLSHGMQPHYDGDHVLGEILRRIEVSDESPRGWRTRVAEQLLDRVPPRYEARVHDTVAAALRHRVDRHPPMWIPPTEPSPDRRFLQVPNNTALGAVRVNVLGRDPHGRVPPADVDRAIDELEVRLREVINVDTGAPAVTGVVRADDVLERHDGDEFPDLFVEWDRSAPIERVWSPRIGTFATRYEHWRTGDHHDRGLLVVRGAGIEPGQRPAVHFEELGPTLARCLDVTLDDVDASPRLDLVPGPHQVATPSDALPEPPERTPLPRPAEPMPVADRALEVAVDAVRRADLADATAPRVEALEAGVQDLEVAVEDLRRATVQAERAQRVWTTMLWLERTDVAEDALISVVTPTHKRPEKLAAAIASVQAQTYGRWEMVVVDDGGHQAKDVIAEIGDDRVRLEVVEHLGSCGARNVALGLATGSIVTYLDDDNLLDPGWLKAVAWAFAEHPDVQVLYGARLLDGVAEDLARGTPGIPWLQFEPFDREVLRLGNFADMGVMAHRAGLPEARFDETLVEFGDWDLFLRLTEHHVPLELPAVALRYFSDGTDRLSGRRGHDLETIRDRWRPEETPGRDS